MSHQAVHGCVRLSSPKSARALEQTHMVGTPLYMAPEMIIEDSSYDTSVDVYSLAMVIWSM